MRYLTAARPRITSLAGFACLATCVSAPVAAQDAGSTSPHLTVVPNVSVSERYTNNIALSSTGKQSEFVTQISPGISIHSNAGRLKGNFDYSLNELIYARGSSPRQSQNALNSSLSLEAVDGFAFVDFSGSISQQSISAFGKPSTDGSSLNSNSTETSVFHLSPYLKGNIGGFADYQVRYGWTSSRSADADVSNIRSTDASANLSGAVRGGPLGWSAGWSSQDVNYSLGRTILADRLNGALTYAFSPQLSGSLLVSRESNNYTSAAKQSHGSAGLGFNWRLSERTTIAAQIENRSFGRSHNISISHRTARTAWQFSDVRDVSDSPAQSGVTTLGSLSDLLFSQFTALEADPIKRGELVNRFMQDNGLRADTQVISNFLASSISLQRRQEASFALLGVRDTITFVMNRGTNSSLSTFTTSLDDLANNTIVHQSGISVLYSHRLTPDASMNILASRQSTSGSTGAESTSLRAVDVSLSSRLGRRVSASIGARKVFFDSATSPYTETAVTGNLNVQF